MTWLAHIMLYRRARSPCQSTYLRSVRTYHAVSRHGRVTCRARLHGHKLGSLIVPLLMIFFSAHHSPSTVNMNAKEFVIGTARLNSVIISVLHLYLSPLASRLTSLPDQNEKPDASRNVEQERYCIRRPTKRADDRIPYPQSFALQPRIVRVCERWSRWGRVV